MRGHPRRPTGRASLGPALALAVVLTVALTGCGSTERRASEVSPTAPARAVAAYDALSMREADADMRRVAACAGQRGLTVRPDVVNGGYAGKGSARSLHVVIASCRSQVYGSRQDPAPRSTDAGRVYDLYLVQAACLREQHYRGAPAPDRKSFVQAFRPGQELPWVPFYGDRSELPRWASAHDLSPQSAYESLLTTCPDPVRMWRYVDPVYRS